MVVFIHILLYWIVWDRFVYGWSSPYKGDSARFFVRNVGSTDIYECFRGLTGSQRTPGRWGVTAWYQILGIQIPRELGFGYPSPLGWFDVEFRYEIT